MWGCEIQVKRVVPLSITAIGLWSKHVGGPVYACPNKSEPLRRILTYGQPQEVASSTGLHPIIRALKANYE